MIELILGGSVARLAILVVFSGTFFFTALGDAIKSNVGHGKKKTELGDETESEIIMKILNCCSKQWAQ